MYKALWNYIKKHVEKKPVSSVFLPVLVLGWTVVGFFAGALICPFLQNATTLAKITVVLCSGGYAGLIVGFFGGIFYIYKGVIKHPRAVTDM